MSYLKMKSYLKLKKSKKNKKQNYLELFLNKYKHRKKNLKALIKWDKQKNNKVLKEIKLWIQQNLIILLCI